MAWLSSLLKELIVIILLAAFVDLLLPNRSMQRYVKTVIGLFLVMVLLTPVFQLFRKDWDANRLVSEAIASVNGTGSSLKMKTLEEIMADSNRLKLLNEKEAAKLAESRASQAIRDGLQQSAGILAKRVSAFVEADGQGGLRLARVEVALPPEGGAPAAGAAATSNAGPDRRPAVDPVKPVSIRIAPEPVRQKAGAAADGGEAAKRVRQYLQQEWRIQPESASVTVDAEP